MRPPLAGGLAKNKRLNTLIATLQDEAAACIAATARPVHWFTDLANVAGSWNRERRMIARIEHSAKGGHPGYVVTSLDGDGQQLYQQLYCVRGGMENHAKKQQLDLFADRTSCHRWWPNPFRLLLSSLANTPPEALRRLALQGTELARAYVGTIRLKLLKIGAVFLHNTAQYPARALPAGQCLS